jgi:hypothetical protein
MPPKRQSTLCRDLSSNVGGEKVSGMMAEAKERVGGILGQKAS